MCLLLYLVVVILSILVLNGNLSVVAYVLTVFWISTLFVSVLSVYFILYCACRETPRSARPERVGALERNTSITHRGWIVSCNPNYVQSESWMMTV